MLHMDLGKHVGHVVIDSHSRCELFQEPREGICGKKNRFLVHGTSGGFMGDRCFLNAERHCEDSCKAFNKKTEDCKLLERSAVVSRSFKLLMSWLGQADPPRVR